MQTARDDLRRGFDSVAPSYDSARPDYPEELFDDLVALAELEPGDRLLEVGCASGKATRPLLQRGFAVRCVELGPRLAAEARRNLAGYPVQIDIAPFESWDAGGAVFDLLYAATAFHWIDPAVRYGKAHQLIRPGGHLALWGAQHAFPADVDPLFVELQPVYEEIGLGRDGEWPPPPPDKLPDWSAEIEAGGLFEVVGVRRYLWVLEYSADEYIALLDTFSEHIALEPARRDRLHDEIRRRLVDRSLRRHWYAILHVARRVGPPV